MNREELIVYSEKTATELKEKLDTLIVNLERFFLYRFLESGNNIEYQSDLFLGNKMRVLFDKETEELCITLFKIEEISYPLEGQAIKLSIESKDKFGMNAETQRLFSYLKSTPEYDFKEEVVEFNKLYLGKMRELINYSNEVGYYKILEKIIKTECTYKIKQVHILSQDSHGIRLNIHVTKNVGKRKPYSTISYYISENNILATVGRMYAALKSIKRASEDLNS